MERDDHNKLLNLILFIITCKCQRRGPPGKMTPGIQQPRTQSSSPSSSFQSSLYRYYSPISSNESTFSRAALQPSTSHNIIQSTADARRCLKRPQNAKDTSITISPLTKKSKQHAKHLHQPSQPQVQPTPCVRRQVPPSLPRSILERNLTSWRQDLARRTSSISFVHSGLTIQYLVCWRPNITFRDPLICIKSNLNQGKEHFHLQYNVATVITLFYVMLTNLQQILYAQCVMRTVESGC